MEEVFGLTPTKECEDIGIQALRTVRSKWWASLIFILFISLTISATDSIIIKYIKVPKSYQPPLVLLSIWTVSTMFALITLSIFGRYPISFLFKFIHVACELLHLAYCLLITKFVTVSNLISMLAIISLAASVNMPCNVSSKLTELGAVLDTANIVAIALIATRTPQNNRIGLAFLLHGTYIWTFLIMVYATNHNEDAILALRLYGFAANCMSVFIMMLGVTYTEKPTDNKILYRIINLSKHDKIKVAIDELNELYCDRTFTSVITLIFIKFVQGFLKYQFNEKSIALTFGNVKYKDCNIEIINSDYVNITKLCDVLRSVVYVTAITVLSFSVNLHWGLVMFYTLTIPNFIMIMLLFLLLTLL